MDAAGGHILVICYGNLCRSPMAEGLLRSRLGENWEISSAGTNAIGGDAPSPMGVEAMRREHGVDISGQRSTPLTVPVLAAADHVFAMSVQQAMLAAALGGRPDTVRLFGAFAPSLEQVDGRADPGGGRANMFEISDPMGGDYDEYRECMDRLQRCTEKAASWLESGADPEAGPPSVGSPRWRFQVGQSTS
jgi:protein-tyrosine phosphatase